jgi:hypothetical protein
MHRTTSGAVVNWMKSSPRAIEINPVSVTQTAAQATPTLL